MLPSTPSGGHRAGALPTSLAAWFDMMKRQPRLTCEEQAALLELAAAGDATARERLVMANLRLVYALARENGGKRVPLEDRLQIGAIGLVNAVDYFQPGRGAEFSTFAAHVILRLLRRHDWEDGLAVRMPGSTHADLARVARALREDPTLEPGEIAARCQLPLELAAALRRAVQRPSSLDQRVAADDDTATLAELLVDEDTPAPHAQLERQEMEAAVQQALARLPAALRTVLQLRFGMDGQEHSRAETAQQMRITASEQRTLEQQALTWLRVSAPELRRLLTDDSAAGGKTLSPGSTPTSDEYPTSGKTALPGETASRGKTASFTRSREPLPITSGARSPASSRQGPGAALAK